MSKEFTSEDIQVATEVLSNQRNAAMNECVNLSIVIRRLSAKNEELEKTIAALKEGDKAVKQ